MSAAAARLVPVILCGGTGTRLWPLSREGYPKQFWPLAGEGTMLQETAARAQGPGFAPPILVASEAHRFLVAEQLREGGVVGSRIVLEPEARNSAPAIAAAALLAAEEDPSAVMWVMAADAHITEREALHAAVQVAARAAATGRVVTFGMRPTSAETGFGYVAQGDPLPGAEGAFTVAEFGRKTQRRDSEAPARRRPTLVEFRNVCGYCRNMAS